MLKIGSERLNSNDFKKVIYSDEKIEIAKKAMEKVKQSFSFLKEFSKDKVIYGINTGFGPMAQYRVSEEDQLLLQYNLIRSHSAGSGELLPDNCVKAAMLARLNTLLQGYSGVNETVVILLKEFINNNIFPHIYKHGGVGASGDLVQLSHLALALIGEGKVNYLGKEYDTIKILNKLKLKPIDIKIREGLALINGTSVMTGINFSNIILSKKLINWSVLISSMINELVRSYDDHFSEELNIVKLHSGQNNIAKSMRNILESSKLVKKRQEHLYNGTDNKVQVFEEKVQEYYSLRCVPQILGPIYDTIINAENILIDEINSVNDNPIIDAENNNVFHGGNFHGDYVSLEADKIKIAVTKLSMLAERQLNFLMNDKLNQILPPFVNLGTLGLNLGMQGAQFTAVSTVAENQTLSNPVYVHSIPNNNDNQDIVSMGANASQMARKVINNTFEVLAIELISIIQAVDYLKYGDLLSQKAKDVYIRLRKIVPYFEEDNIKYNDIKNVINFIKNNELNLKTLKTNE
ncbi:MAG: aromatic amino acid ammonia-lyase [Bacteroidales bacterium]|nr:aromatic amino acid ammonia-lyase [Bacteroidales bacterium]